MHAGKWDAYEQAYRNTVVTKSKNIRGLRNRWLARDTADKDAGFAVTVEETTDLQPIRKRLGVPADLAACHTAEVDGYVVEGHVPASAVRRLLEKRPTATGLAVPGMPAGSPGMEGGTPHRYAVVLFGANGRQPFMHFVGAENVG